MNTPHARWRQRLATAALAFVMVGVGPEVIELATHHTPSAEAQWGQARRVSRRTSRRTTARQNYIYSLPAGYRTVVRGGTTYYVAGGTYYKPVYTEGRVAYVVVDID